MLWLKNALAFAHGDTPFTVLEGPFKKFDPRWILTRSVEIRMHPPQMHHEGQPTISNLSTPHETSAAILPMVYEELRRIARHRMVGENGEQTLQATAPVHEAYLRPPPMARRPSGQTSVSSSVPRPKPCAGFL